ncbi:MAG TPA: DUF362 domain-containing protein [Chthoniobacterales bacterium]|nr:DUF362 domain-containing protein [Chthoniobacterales bacterium]
MSIAFPPIKSTIAARLIRSIAFLFAGVGWCAAAFAQGPPPPAPPPPGPTPSIVYRASNPAAITDYRTNPEVVRRMTDELVLAVTHQPDIASAWRSLVKPNDRVGIKISAAGGELFTTHRDIVNAIVDGLVAAGHQRQDIIVWDKSLGGIKEGGYTRGEGYQLKSIPPRDGYDPKAIISEPFLGNLIWGDFEYVGNKGQVPLLSDTANTSSLSHFSKIVANEVTKIINLPVLSDSVRNGVAGCLYNVTIPNIDNWRRFGVPPDFGASSIPEIYNDPHIGQKVVLNLMDGLLAQYAGGPQSQPGYAFPFATLYASKDPVAIDSIALRQLEEWRKKGKLPAIKRMGAHVLMADQLGLGNANPVQIQIRDVGR